MPIAKYTPAAPQPNPLNFPKVQPDNYKGVVVDDKYSSLHSLTRYVEGYPLTVDYYGQLMGENNSPREIDPAQSGVYQQYVKIHHLDIRVDKPLEMDYNDDSGLSVITGSANIYPDIKPNTFDYFTARVTRGRTALFRITRIHRMSMNRDSVNNAEYQMVGYVDDGDAKIFLESLEAKIKREYYFSGDRLSEGASPLLKKQEHEYVDGLFRDATQIAEYYVESFMNHSYQTLVVPGQPQAVYDKFVTDFVLKILSVTDHHKVPYIKQLGSDQDRYMQQPQFWKAIAERNPLFITQANKFMGLVNRLEFNRNNYIAGAGMSLIDQYVYPIQVDGSSRLPNDPAPFGAGPGLSDTAGPNGQICSRGNNSFTSGGETTLLYKRMLADPYYVLSRDFYENQNNWCVLEKVTWDYLEGKSLQMDELSALTKQYYSLARLEQFYYGPLLLTFIKDSRFAQYTER